MQAGGQGWGLRGFARTPLLKDLYTRLSCIPERLKLVHFYIENHHRSNKSGCNYASLFVEDLHGTCTKLFTQLQ